VDRHRQATGTRALVLRLMRAHGALSRVELAAHTGLTVAAMTTVMRNLLLDNLIEEAGSSGNTGGKPRTMLRLIGEAAYAIGVSVDLTSTSFVLVDFAAEVVRTLPARASGGSAHELADSIAGGISELMALSGVAAEKVLGIGIAAQGPHDWSMVGPAAAGPYADQWLDPAVGRLVEDRTGMAVFVQNDANAAAVAEFSLSLDARASGNFACIYLGQSGLGSGIFADGQLVLGRNSYAGAVAHLSIDADGPPCFCGGRGCLELYGSPRAIIEAVRAHDEISPESAIGVSSRGPLAATDMELLYEAARSGHTYAAEVVATVARYIASACATMATLLDLDLIVLAGAGFVGMEPAFLRATRDVSERFREVGARPDFAVRMSTLGVGNEAAAVGAAVGVLEFVPERAPVNGEASLNLLPGAPESGAITQ
jgi:predicted NBD/HSP70 family sugar kinase